MSTAVICPVCGEQHEYYRDEEPYQEVEEVCPDCEPN